MTGEDKKKFETIKDDRDLVEYLETAFISFTAFEGMTINDYKVPYRIEQASTFTLIRLREILQIRTNMDANPPIF